MKYPITPPPKLVDQWCDPRTTGSMHFDRYDLAARAAQWGADQELEACCEWLEPNYSGIEHLRTARRPKPPSLKEQALEALKDLGKELPIQLTVQYGTVRHALEQLPDNE